MDSEQQPPVSDDPGPVQAGVELRGVEKQGCEGRDGGVGAEEEAAGLQGLCVGHQVLRSELPGKRSHDAAGVQRGLGLPARMEPHVRVAAVHVPERRGREVRVEPRGDDKLEEAEVPLCEALCCSRRHGMKVDRELHVPLPELLPHVQAASSSSSSSSPFSSVSVVPLPPPPLRRGIGFVVLVVLSVASPIPCPQDPPLPALRLVAALQLPEVRSALASASRAAVVAPRGPCSSGASGLALPLSCPLPAEQPRRPEEVLELPPQLGDLVEALLLDPPRLAPLPGREAAPPRADLVLDLDPLLEEVEQREGVPVLGLDLAPG